MSNQPNKGGGAQKAARVAQLAKGIADIVKGAAAGGLHGAAVGAVKAFAPQIIKALIYILLFFLLIPVIIFFAIPNMFFQMPSVNDPEVAAFTNQAMSIESIYGSIDNLTQEEADKIIQSLAAGHDEVNASCDFSSINRYWLIAISSVLHEQGMGISESDVRGLISQNLSETHTIDTWQEQVGYDENDEPIYEERSRINISVTNNSHNVLMAALGFTQFQIDWAYFLYENICDAQITQHGYEDLPGYGAPLINYGDLVFTDGGRDVVYYNQTDERWGNHMYGTMHTIAVGGCGPTALAMVVSSMTDRMIEPKEMADWSVENGHCCDGNGSYHTLINMGAEHFGLAVKSAGVGDGQQIIDALADGKLVVAIMGPGHFTVSGHFIVLRGVTAEGQILVADPVSVRKTGLEWDFRIILSEASRKTYNNGPFWIIG